MRPAHEFKPGQRVAGVGEVWFAIIVGWMTGGVIGFLIAHGIYS